MRPPAKQLPSVVDVYGDSQEIANGLRLVKNGLDCDGLPEDAYWCEEAAVHIEGLYHLARELERQNKVLRKRLETV